MKDFLVTIGIMLAAQVSVEIIILLFGCDVSTASSVGIYTAGVVIGARVWGRA